MVTVLVADNDPGVRSLLVEVVRRQGCAVEGAIDGEAARQRLQLGGIDVLVCDLDMPRLSGNDLLSWIEQQAARPVVVVVSGYVDAKLEAALGSLSCVRSVLRKPFDVFAFAQQVRGLAASVASPTGPAGAASPASSLPPSSPERAAAEVVRPAPAPVPEPPIRPVVEAPAEGGTPGLAAAAE